MGGSVLVNVSLVRGFLIVLFTAKARRREVSSISRCVSGCRVIIVPIRGCDVYEAVC